MPETLCSLKPVFIYLAFIVRQEHTGYGINQHESIGAFLQVLLIKFNAIHLNNRG